MPGLFTNYLAHPHKTATHFRSFENPFDFDNRRAVIREGSENDIITLTTVQDLANVVALAVEYKDEWPVVGGIRGTDISLEKLLLIGQQVRGIFCSNREIDIQTY
jgi:hypothetical protein